MLPIVARPTHVDGRYIGSVDPDYKPRFSVKYRDPEGERILYAPLAKQDKLHACKAPNIWYGGAAGGGKSHGARWHAYINCLRTSGLKVLLLRRQFKELETTHLLEIPKELPAAMATYHSTLHRLTFNKTKSFVQFGHAHSLKDVRSYLSTAWDIIIVDEASEFLPIMLSLLQSRLRTKLTGIRPQLILVSNPGGEAHLWLVSRFIAKKVDPTEDGNYQPNEYEFIQSLVGDNDHNDDFYLDRLLSLPEADREAFLFGNMEAFAGQYFSEWAKSKHVLGGIYEPEDAGIEEWWEVEGGMDWGYDPNPGILLTAAFDPFGRPFGLRELMFRKQSPREVAENIVAQCTWGGERKMTIRGDSAMWIRQVGTGVSIADEINDVFGELDADITLVQANKNRINGWMRVHQFLDTRRPDPAGSGEKLPYQRILDTDPKAIDGERFGWPYFVSTIGAQMHSEKMDGDMKKQNNDHGADADRYLLMGREPLSVLPRELRPHKTHGERIAAFRRKALAENRKRHDAARIAQEEAEPVSERIPGLDDDDDDDDVIIGDGVGDLWN